MVNLFINGELLDQYKDESVDIVSSVLDVSDITKNTGDYSKSFTIPASKVNNRIFKHWYNASIDNGFDARSKVEGSIDIDGVPFKLGTFRLNKCNIVKGRLESYTINFFGNLPNIKDTLGDDLLSDINFVKFNHEWEGNNVMKGLRGELLTPTDRDVIYTPMASKRYFYDSDSSAGDFDDKNINIARFGNPASATGILWNDLRPSIKAKTIIDNIQHKYGTGTKQVVEVVVTQASTSSSGLSMNLNGLEDNVTIVATSANFIASAIQSFINGSSILAPHFIATRLNNVVTITSVEMELEINPSFFVENTTAGLDLEISVTKVGAFPYENPIVFSEDFFGTTEFEKMYLWLKRDEDNNIGQIEFPIAFSTGDLTDIDTLTNTITYYSTFTAVGTPVWTFTRARIDTIDATGYENIPFTLIRKLKTTLPNGDVLRSIQETPAQVNSNGTINGISQLNTWRASGNNLGTTTFEVQYFIRANTNFKIGALLTREAGTYVFGSSPTYGTPTIAGSPTTGAINKSIVSISNQMPKIKISEFLKGIFDMFKLVIIPQDDGSMYVNSLDSFYDQGKRYDITNKVDFSKFEVKRGELYQTIAYQFEEPTTILNEEFKNRSRDGQGYGSSLVNIYESVRPIKLIDGKKVEIKLPFEQVIFERLTDVNSSTSNDSLNISIATIADKVLEPVTPKPLLHYISIEDISNSPIKFIDDNNVTNTLSTRMVMPMNQFGTIDAIYALLFESEFSSWDGSILNKNLYTIHHKDYIQAIFELKRRTFIYTANLPIQVVTRLDLNDVIAINGIDYRINKYSYNLLNGLTKLELINGFDTRLGNRVYIPSVINVGRYLTDLAFNVQGISTDYVVTKVDTGDGTTWANTSVIGADNNLAGITIGNISVLNGVTRSMIIRYVANGVTTDIIILQNE
jgi:hypothetical protein